MVDFLFRRIIILIVLVHILLYKPLLNWVGLDNKLIWSQITDNALWISAITEFSGFLIGVLSLLFLAVNIKVLLSEPLLYFDVGSWGSLLDFGIAHHGVSGAIPIVTHFSVELARVAYFLGVFHFFETMLHLDALVNVFNLMQDFGWNLIAALKNFKRLVL